MLNKHALPSRNSPRVIIACRSTKPELEALRPDGGEIEMHYLEQNLHRTPEKMPQVISREIESVQSYASQIVLGYGLCSNGVVGVVAPEQGLIVPRVHDCIALFLGSRRAYDRAFRRNPGTYYLTPGWIQEQKDPLGYMNEEYIPKLGRETAEWGLKEELKHYTHIILIDTGIADIEPLRERALENAQFLDKTFEETKGTHDYFEKILFGPYTEEDFIILKQGEKVTQKSFFNS